jgi:hypothetical protein
MFNADFLRVGQQIDPTFTPIQSVHLVSNPKSLPAIKTAMKVALEKFESQKKSWFTFFGKPTLVGVKVSCLSGEASDFSSYGGYNKQKLVGYRVENAGWLTRFFCTLLVGYYNLTGTEKQALKEIKEEKKSGAQKVMHQNIENPGNFSDKNALLAEIKKRGIKVSEADFSAFPNAKFSAREIRDLISACPNLTTIKLPNETDQFLALVLLNKENAFTEAANESGMGVKSTRVPVDRFFEFFKTNPSLSLDFSNDSTLVDSDLVLVGHYLQLHSQVIDIPKLDLSNCPNITREGLRSFLNAISHLNRPSGLPLEKNKGDLSERVEIVYTADSRNKYSNTSQPTMKVKEIVVPDSLVNLVLASHVSLRYDSINGEDPKALATRLYGNSFDSDTVKNLTKHEFINLVDMVKNQ